MTIPIGSHDFPVGNGISINPLTQVPGPKVGRTTDISPEPSLSFSSNPLPPVLESTVTEWVIQGIWRNTGPRVESPHVDRWGTNIVSEGHGDFSEDEVGPTRIY